MMFVGDDGVFGDGGICGWWWWVMVVVRIPINACRSNKHC